MISTTYQLTRTFFLKATHYRLKRSSIELNRTLFDKTARTLLLFTLLSVLPYLIPGMERYRILIPAKTLALFKAPDPQISQRSLITESQNRVESDNASSKEVETEVEVETEPGEIEDPSGHALNNFYMALLKAEKGEGVVRISHYGDSPITNDGITSTVRRLFQTKFGDAGHGYILAGKPWGWYGHLGVTHSVSGGWKSEPMFISRGDHLYGLGGASFTASEAGVTASFGTAPDGEIGEKVTRFDIYYLAQPGGGELDIDVDGAAYGRLSTASDEVRSGFYQVELEAGRHEMTLRTVGNGEVRIYGVVLESGTRGVEYDSLGVNGAFIGLLAHYLDKEHWIEQLRHRRPDLVILAYGANESEYEGLSMEQYEKDTKEVIGRIRAALPRVSIMLLGPMDRGKRGEGGEIVTRPMIKQLTSYQRKIAAETGCAFFDTFTAMGGEGTVARWREARPRLMGGDFTHPTAQGAEIVGSLIYDAIIRAYENYKD
jgi:lysophospholipase L1-like esterase